MAIGNKNQISVVIINYGTADFTIKAVKSIFHQTPNHHNLKIYVVDNASVSDDVTLLNKAHSESDWGEAVEIWPLRFNLGFGGGNNVVLNHLAKEKNPPEFVLFLNPDAAFENDIVSIFLDSFRKNSSQAAVGALVVRSDTGKAVVSSFRFPNFINECVSALSFGPLSRLFDRFEVAKPPNTLPEHTDWVTGAAFMVDFAFLKKVGFFDPDFFLYYEETELMYRLKKAGGVVKFEPSARVSHYAGAATGMEGGQHRNKAQPIYIYDSWRLYFFKTKGWALTCILAIAKFVSAMFGITLKKVLNKPQTLPKGYLKDFFQYSLKPLFIGRARLRHYPEKGAINNHE